MNWKSRPPCEGVGRNRYDATYYIRQNCRPPCEGVGRNNFNQLDNGIRGRRPPCEGVGRNCKCVTSFLLVLVALHVRAWVEMRQMMVAGQQRQVALHVRAWVEIAQIALQALQLARRPPCEGVGRNRLLL